VARLPFNPNDLPDRDVGKPARRERKGVGADAAASALTVTQVTLLIKDTLADHTPRPLRVVGEISNFSERGHWYLSLKDEENVLSGVMWKSAAGKVGFQPQRGMKVVATGRLDYYGPQARLQMYLDKLEPVGQGELELRFRQLCDQLRELGYFDHYQRERRGGAGRDPHGPPSLAGRAPVGRRRAGAGGERGAEDRPRHRRR